MYKSFLRSDDLTFVDLPMDKLLAAYDSMELSDEVCGVASESGLSES
ncbi:MAG: hypothetical protein IPG99_12800 [Ignavibacteria bacterium]|nr:hypothetical protein [Ignavibacteria bacterium]